VLGTNPWFKKPRAIGEKVDGLRMFLEVRSEGKIHEELSRDIKSKIESYIAREIIGQNG